MNAVPGNRHAGNDQITRRQHIGANPAGQRIEYRRGPDQEKRRMVPAGSTATSAGSRLIAAATAAHPDG
ncbi:conserved transmembrane domain protein [Mycobacterium kansasii]|uniref:Conserved transmembrane domain protein n=1 Tax=Mycobacterium kansasii TaxID=1768 RepID=A0A1V3WSP9_MYCKA|nr:conserved transmembrane domain protein [Mycobacterium kansasii]